MSNWLVQNEIVIRLSAFALIFAVCGLAEYLWQRRNPLLTRIQRWPSNIGLVVISTILVRLLIPVSAVAAAILATKNHIGLFNNIDTPVWLSFCLSLLALDLAIYIQHLVTHKIPFLWRLHRTHHTDVQFDVSTALRFHPVEIVLSIAYKIVIVTLLGAPAAAVVVFEVLLNGTAMFNHSNLNIPIGIDRILRKCIVTPDMHRVHHSVFRDETDSNYGFNFSFWDKIFRTYIDQPRAGHETMQIGQPIFRQLRDQRIDQLLVQPLRND